MGVHEFVNYLGMDFNISEAFGGCNMNDATAIMIMGGRTCHPCWVSSGRSMTYLSSFLVMTSKGILLLHYVNSKKGDF